MLSLIRNLFQGFTSILSPYKLIIYAVLLVSICGLITYFVHEYKKGQEAIKQLTAEHLCSEGSECFSRAQKAAEAGAKAVTDAIAEVKAQEDRAAQDRQNQAKADKEASDKAINEANHAKDLWEQRYRTQIAKDKDCAAWSLEKISCELP